MSLSELCSNIIVKKDVNKEYLDKDPMEFITAPWGLGLGSSPEVPPLYPVQRVIFKCYYGMELDGSSNRDIIINDMFNENELYRFNEQEYMSYVYEEGRTNRKYEPGKFYPNMLLVIGRRSGKTLLTSCIKAYELYKLLNKYSPQQHYSIMPEASIKMTCISTSKETAKELFDNITGHISRSEFFRKFRGKPTQEKLYFRTQRDLDKYGEKGLASVIVRVAPCTAKGLRGPGNISIGFDEFAFFFADEKNSGKGKDKSGEEIYNAASPSVAKFKKPDGSPDGKIITISSPGPKSGKFYSEFERSFEDDNDDLFMMQAPTWEVDPNLSSQYLRNKYKSNPITFKSEFGAQFTDRLFGWIDDPDIVRQNVIPGLAYKSKSMLRVPHFMGVDVGLKNDGSSISVGHWVNELVGGAREDLLEVDSSIVRYAQDEGKDYFDPEEISEWIVEMCKNFNIAKGLLDQYYGMSIIPSLKRKGLKQFEYRQFTDSLNSEVYQILLTTMISKKLRMPEGPVSMVNEIKRHDSALVEELLTLQAEQKSKYMIRVFAPERDDQHDDLSDSFARMVFIANEYQSKSFSHNITSQGGGRGINPALISRRYELKKAQLNRPSGRYMRNVNRSNGSILNNFR